jgi:hypothetical protein
MTESAADDFCLIAQSHDQLGKDLRESSSRPIYMEPGDKLTVAASAANSIIVTAYGRIL